MTCLTRRKPSLSRGSGAIVSEKGKSERNTLNLVELIHFEMLDLGAFFGRGVKKLEIRRRILLSLLPWLQLLKAGPQEDVILLLGVVELVLILNMDGDEAEVEVGNFPEMWAEELL